jgi:hypothetical protein
MATIKTVNYTAEQTAKAIEMFKAGETIDVIAKAFNKTSRSIIAKLSREGIYKAKERTAKDGSAVVHKEELVAQIAGKIGVDADTLGGLEKATKQTLKLIFDNLA